MRGSQAQGHPGTTAKHHPLVIMVLVCKASGYASIDKARRETWVKEARKKSADRRIDVERMYDPFEKNLI